MSTSAPVTAQLEPTSCSGSVTVEDKPPLKCCSACLRSLPPSAFSGAQIKRKGKRACRGCVEHREADAAKEAGDSASAATAKVASAQSSSASTGSAAAPSSADSRSCVVCGKGAVKLRQCSRCLSHYCGLACLKKHNSAESQQCEAIRTMPPLSIYEEDRITAAEIELHWPRIRQRLHQLALAERNPVSAKIIQNATSMGGLSITAAELSVVVDLYPPSAASPWWLEGQAGRRVADLLLQFGLDFFRVISSIGSLYGVAAQGADDTSQCSVDQVRGLVYRPTTTYSSAVEDESRLFHRLLRYWIYYFRHVDSQLIRSTERPFVDVQSDEQGQWPPPQHSQASRQLERQKLDDPFDPSMRSFAHSLIHPFAHSLFRSLSRS